MEQLKMRIWGLDLGTTSIGFAVIEHDSIREEGCIERLGVRIFPESITVARKEPPNKIRRRKRLMRRGVRRRKLRRRLLNEALAIAGLLPQFGTREWFAVVANDPYYLRRYALTQPLHPHQLGRVLYHLAKRRGFAGRTALEKTNNSNDAVARQNPKILVNEIRERTDAYIAEQPKTRGHHHTREMVKEEFNQMWAAQRPHHPVLADPVFEARIRHLVFFQRPVFWRPATLGRCPWVPGSALAPKGSWTAQRYLVLEQLTKLRIVGSNGRPLSDNERVILLNLAHQQKSISWHDVRRALRNEWQQREEAENQLFNLEVSGGESGIKGNIVEIELRKVFGEEWSFHPHRDAIRHDIYHRLWSAHYVQVGHRRVEIRALESASAGRRAAAATMKCDWGLTDQEATALAKLELPIGRLRLSIDAIEKLLPELERGHGVGQLLNGPKFAVWREKTFPNRDGPTGEVRDRLPSHPRSMPEVRNSTINRSLNELRKVVNNLISVYGRPDLIRIELTRDLKESRSRRADRFANNKRKEADRTKAIADLEAHGIHKPSRDDIEKWLLWKESDKCCPYTGDHICFEALFHEGRFQVEHIWPRSRSLDNTFANKTLCRTDVNILKGNRTPFEMYAHDPDAWRTLKQRLDACKLEAYKVRRFTADMVADVNSDDFANRLLADTGWAARQAREFLRRLWPDDGSIVRVDTVNGRITAQLRHQWGLNAILDPKGHSKNRADHRHHAVDAFVVCLTSRSFVKRLADWHHLRETGVRAPQLSAPWRGVFEIVKEKISSVVVSHKTRRKVSGALHAETVMGDTSMYEKTKSGTYHLFTTRKAVDRLSTSEIGSIRDRVVREIVARHVAERGGDPKKAFPPYPRLPGTNGAETTEIHRVRLLVKQQRDLMVKVGTGYADAGANHHVAAFRKADGRVIFQTVSLHEAARRVAARKPVIERARADEALFVMSLSPGDTIEFPAGHDRCGLRVVTSVWSSGVIVTEACTDAEAHPWRPTIASIVNARARKVSIDPIGRIWPAGD